MPSHPRLVRRMLSAAPSPSGRGQRLTFEVCAINPLSVAATVEIVHPGFDAGFRVTSASHPHGLDAGEPVWSLTVPPGGREVLTYTIDTGG